MRLKYRVEFEKVLANYIISPQAQEVLKYLQLVLLLAPTSTGRSVISRRLIDSGRYYYIVSDTTRPPQVRDGKLEQEGVQYHFKTEEEVLAGLKAGNFLEAELIHNQQVSGISIQELKKACRSGKIAFTEADMAGVTNVKLVKPDSIAVFLLPPSFTEWQRRIYGRGGASPAEIKRRLKTAVRLLEKGPKLDYFKFVIAGDDVERTVRIIDDLAAGRPNPQQARGLELARQLLAELKKTLTED